MTGKFFSYDLANGRENARLNGSIKVIPWLLQGLLQKKVGKLSLLRLVSVFVFPELKKLFANNLLRVYDI